VGAGGHKRRACQAAQRAGRGMRAHAHGGEALGVAHVAGQGVLGADQHGERSGPEGSGQAEHVLWQFLGNGGQAVHVGHDEREGLGSGRPLSAATRAQACASSARQPRA
jgi:hypothetical protein